MTADPVGDEHVEVVSVEVAQEYTATLLGFAPLQLSDDSKTSRSSHLTPPPLFITVYNVVVDNLAVIVDKFRARLLEKVRTHPFARSPMPPFLVFTV